MMLSALSAILLLQSAAVDCRAPLPSAAAEAPQQTLLVQATQQLCTSMTSRYDQVSVELLSTANIAEPVLEQMSPAVISLGVMRAGRIPVSITWLNARAQRQQGVLWFRVRGMASAWVFNTDLRAEAQLTDANVAKEIVDLAALDSSREQVSSAPIGKAVTTAVRKGHLVRNELLKDPALVARNQRVRVLAKQRGLHIATRGVALTTGWQLGDKVTVEVAGAQESVMAKVSGKGEVHVEM